MCASAGLLTVSEGASASQEAPNQRPMDEFSFLSEPHQNEVIPQQHMMHFFFSVSAREAAALGQVSDVTPPHPRVTEDGMSE